MSDRATCPVCETRNAIALEGRGNRFRCRDCRHVFTASGGSLTGLWIVLGISVGGLVLFVGTVALFWRLFPTEAPPQNVAVDPLQNDPGAPPKNPINVLPKHVAHAPPPPPGGPKALDDVPGRPIQAYNDDYVPPPNLSTTLPQWFHQRNVELPLELRNQLQPNQHHGVLAMDSPLWTDLERKTQARAIRRSGLVMGRAGQIHVEDYPANGGLLIGFFLAKSGFVPYVQPIYLTRHGEVVGRAYGQPTANAVCFKARPGYAVGGAYVHSGELLNGVALTFMRVERTKLDVTDWYQSGWVGQDGGSSGVMGHDGSFVVGIHGRILERAYFTPRGGMTTVGLVSLR